jgi:hypothetical protein
MFITKPLAITLEATASKVKALRQCRGDKDKPKYPEADDTAPALGHSTDFSHKQLEPLFAPMPAVLLQVET